ncbi:MAG: MarR family transcriptional regulator [Desulfobacterota bacterium]|nr:MarR family transcriptional regulator [Thermodesulfobacteriota bacterium]
MTTFRQSSTSDDVYRLYVHLQKIFRSLSFGRSLQGKKPTLTGTQMRILSFFNENNVVHITEISRMLGMSVQSVNNLVARLEALGYVERSKNKEDKRLSDIKLTAKGRQGFQGFREEQLETLCSILERLAPCEQHLLAAAIETAAHLFEKAALAHTTPVIAEQDACGAALTGRGGKR